MAKKASKTLIGTFIVSALTLAILAVWVFGSGKFFADKLPYVMFFDGSVKGLNVGSPVVFRGVKIGTVTNIVLRYSYTNRSFLIPVYVELDPRAVITDRPLVSGQQDQFTQLIEKGLRAQLQMQSIVTGQLMIYLDFFPDKKIRLVGLEDRYPEIPTIPSSIDEILKTAEAINWKGLFDKISNAIDGIDKAVNSREFTSSIKSLDEASRELKPVLLAIKDATVDIRKIVAKGDKIPEQVEQTLTIANKTLQEAKQTLISYREIVSENSVLTHEINTTLEEVSNTVRSVRYLTDYLEQHPESLISGKKTSKGE
ncbi:MAG: MlaD family protein [Syntrophorhabdaceae bacterium]|nr:MlaD family protein [Syntrophorhabdaceae bacterium]MDD5244364.1 MlaD family protein [Syntrophorhabdaceae bacterium]